MVIDMYFCITKRFKLAHSNFLEMSNVDVLTYISQTSQSLRLCHLHSSLGLFVLVVASVAAGTAGK